MHEPVSIKISELREALFELLERRHRETVQLFGQMFDEIEQSRSAQEVVRPAKPCRPRSALYELADRVIREILAEEKRLPIAKEVIEAMSHHDSDHPELKIFRRYDKARLVIHWLDYERRARRTTLAAFRNGLTAIRKAAIHG